MSTETQKVDASYLEGIKSGREAFRKYGVAIAHEEADNLKRTIKGFERTSPVGQFLRGELDFWRRQLARVGGAA